MNIVKQIIEFIKNLLGLDKAKKPSAKKPSAKKPSNKDPYGLVASGTDYHGNTVYEPKKSNPDGKVTKILWKPKSDVDPNVVVVVECNSVRSKDLKLEILGKGRKPLKVGIRMSGRANGNRINYRLDRPAKKFNKSAPLKLRFYQMVKGKKVVVQFKGKDSLQIKQPTRRKDV